MKYIKLMLTLFCLFIGFVHTAYACDCAIPFGDEARIADQAMLDEAEFVGKFSVLAFDFLDFSNQQNDRKANISLNLVRSFNEKPVPQTLQVTSDLTTNCGRVFEAGQKVNLVVFKGGTGLYIKGMCEDLSEEMWKSLEVSSLKILDHKEYNSLAFNLDQDKYRLDLDQFIEKSKGDDVVILDLRSKGEYNVGHIKGSVNIGAADITEEKLQELIPSKDTTILAYCSNSLAPIRMISLTTIAFPQLYAHGYHNSYLLKETWISNGNIVDMQSTEEKLNFVYSEKKITLGHA